VIKKETTLGESVDETGLFDKYCCVSKYVKGKREIWSERTYYRTKADKRCFGILNKKICHLKLLAQSYNFPCLCQKQMQLWKDCFHW
jgi:hypothetical protein